MKLRVKYNLNMEPDGYWRFQAWVDECDQDDASVFVYQKKPIQPSKPEIPEFTDIASRHDMAEYPEDSPEGNITFYRTKSMDIKMRDSLELQNAIGNITKALDRLVASYEVIA